MWNLEPLASGGQSGPKLIPHVICQYLYAWEKKTLNEDLFYRGSSANLPRLHTCENKVPFWDFSQFAVTLLMVPAHSTCSWYLLMILAHNTCSRYLLTVPALGTCLWYLLTVPTYGTCSQYLLPVPAYDTCSQYLFMIPTYDTCSWYLLCLGFLFLYLTFFLNQFCNLPDKINQANIGNYIYIYIYI